MSSFFKSSSIFKVQVTEHNGPEDEDFFQNKTSAQVQVPTQVPQVEAQVPQVARTQAAALRPQVAKVTHWRGQQGQI